MLLNKVLGSSAALPLPEFVSSSTGYSSAGAPNVTTPSGMQEGDLIVAVLTMTSGTNYVTGIPSGFETTVHYTVDNPTGLYIATKVATASEPGSYTFTTDNIGDRVNAVVFAFRNATRVNTLGSPTFVTSATQTAASITPTSAGVLIAVFCWEKGPSDTISTPPTGMTEMVFSPNSQNTSAVYYLENTSTAATSSYTATLTSSAAGFGIQFQIANELPVAPEFVASAAQNNASTGANLTINKPTGTLEGDIMVAFMGANGTAGNWTDTTFTEVADLGAALSSLRVAYKVAGSSEPSSYTFTNASSSRRLGGVIVTYRYGAYDTVGTFAVAANPTYVPSVSAGSSQSILLACGIATTIKNGSTVGMTTILKNSSDAPTYLIAASVAPKGPSGLRVFIDTSDSGILMTIKPA